MNIADFLPKAKLRVDNERPETSLPEATTIQAALMIELRQGLWAQERENPTRGVGLDSVHEPSNCPTRWHLGEKVDVMRHDHKRVQCGSVVAKIFD
ncbi:MAG: hypothetical protein U0231_20220 [Nitrospiraceae bacterium]